MRFCPADWELDTHLDCTQVYAEEVIHVFGAAEEKVYKVMHEYKKGTLKSGSGRKVKRRKQAIAIAMSESGQSNAARMPAEDR